MTDSSRLAYDDFSTPQQMHADCEATERNLKRNLGRRPRLERAARAAVQPAPSIHFEDFPREVGKRDIEVSEAAARLANALHLHLD
jgi:hypothetical protein